MPKLTQEPQPFINDYNCITRYEVNVQKLFSEHVSDNHKMPKEIAEIMEKINAKLPENEKILGLCGEQFQCAYVLQELAKSDTIYQKVLLVASGGHTEPCVVSNGKIYKFYNSMHQSGADHIFTMLDNSCMFGENDGHEMPAFYNEKPVDVVNHNWKSGVHPQASRTGHCHALSIKVLKSLTREEFAKYRDKEIMPQSLCKYSQSNKFLKNNGVDFGRLLTMKDGTQRTITDCRQLKSLYTISKKYEEKFNTSAFSASALNESLHCVKDGIPYNFTKKKQEHIATDSQCSIF